MSFWRIYFSRRAWLSPYVLMASGLHLFCFCTSDVSWVMLPVGFLIIAAVLLFYVFLATRFSSILLPYRNEDSG